MVTGQVHMEDGKGKIFIEPLKPRAFTSGSEMLKEHKVWTTNFCRYCGSGDLNVTRQTTFGNPGYIEHFECRKCGGRM